MKETLETINRMQTDGVIGKYAIGGAVGATFYLEPAATLDIDIFVMLPGQGQSLLISLSPIYDYLKRHGYKPEGEHIVIDRWPVQFLTPGNSLETEALLEAVEVDAGGIPTRVMTAEHLAAIALRTGGAQDRAWIICFLESGAVDQSRLEDIVVRNGLLPNWENFTQKYPEIPQIIDARRKQLASLSFGEKLELLGKLRERSLMLAEAGEQLAKKLSPASNVSGDYF